MIFNLQLQNFNEATLLFDEYENSVSLELLKEIEKLSTNF